MCKIQIIQDKKHLGCSTLNIFEIAFAKFRNRLYTFEIILHAGEEQRKQNKGRIVGRDWAIVICLGIVPIGLWPCLLCYIYIDKYIYQEKYI